MEERFWEKVDIRGEDDCWPWLAAKSGISNPYILREDPKFGLTRADADRVGYRTSAGAHVTARACKLALVLSGVRWKNPTDHLHHWCENHMCCNPAHLEFVTPEMHVVLTWGTKCKRGHPRTPENHPKGKRGCGDCAKEMGAKWTKKWWAEKRRLGLAKVPLAETIVREIRLDSRKHREIAADHGISPCYVSQIKSGKARANVV